MNEAGCPSTMRLEYLSFSTSVLDGSEDVGNSCDCQGLPEISFGDYRRQWRPLSGLLEYEKVKHLSFPSVLRTCRHDPLGGAAVAMEL